MDRTSWTPSPALRTLIVLAVLALASALPPAAPAAPRVERRELANGLTVVVEERPDSPAIGVTLVARAGTRDDAPARAGEVALLARAYFGGTPTRPSVERLTRAVQATGGEIDLAVDIDLTRYTAVVPAGELETALDALSDMLRNPRFGVADLAEALEETATGAYTVADERLAAALWPDHPAGQQSSGTDESLERITYADLLALRERFFGARNLTLTVVGPAEAGAVFARADAYFGALPPGMRQPVRRTASAPPDTTPRTFPAPGEQAAVVMAFPTVGLDSPDYPAVTLLSLLLSGPDGLIFADVRSAHGLARNVDAGAITYADVGAVLAFAQVQPRNVNATLDRFLSVFDQLRREPVSEAVLQRLRDRFAGEQILARGAAQYRSIELADAAALERPTDEAAFLAALARITPEDLRRAAERYLAPDRAIVHVRGPRRSSGDTAAPAQ